MHKNAHWRLLSVLIEVKNNFQTFSLGLFVLFGREITERKDAKNVYKLGQGHDITFDKFLTSFLILFPSTVSFFSFSFIFIFLISWAQNSSSKFWAKFKDHFTCEGFNRTHLVGIKTLFNSCERLLLGALILNIDIGLEVPQIGANSLTLSTS